MKAQGYRFDRMVAAGGGAKSRLWLEIKASIYNCPILVPSEPECGVIGCGMLAGCASGLFSNLETVISQQVRYDTTKSIQIRRGPSDTPKCNHCLTISTPAADNSGIGLRVIGPVRANSFPFQTDRLRFKSRQSRSLILVPEQ